MMTATSIPARREQTIPAPPPRLLDVLQQAAGERGHSVETIRGTDHQIGANTDHLV